MRVTVLAIGQKMPAWAQTAFDDYAKRMPSEWKFSCKALKAEPRGNTSAEKIMAIEGQRILQAVQSLGPQTQLIVLDEHGQRWRSTELSAQLKMHQDQGHDVAFVIGGADGLAPAVKQAARQRLRISDMTLPHAMVRVLLTEQIYRAWSLLAGHPYHRE